MKTTSSPLVPKYDEWASFSGWDKEPADFGMYTYVLFGHKIIDSSDIALELEERYQAVLNTITATIDRADSGAVESWRSKKEINLFCLPGSKSWMSKFDLKDYNFDLAKDYIGLFSKVIGDTVIASALRLNEGPFLISTIIPAADLQAGENFLLFWDMSGKNPGGTKEFIKNYRSRIFEDPLKTNEAFSSGKLSFLSALLDANDMLEDILCVIVPIATKIEGLFGE